MKHQGTKTLETPRLILRRFQEGDGDFMYKNWASDPEVTKFLTWPTHPSVEVSRKINASWVANYEKPDYYQWAIVPKELGEPIGSIAVVEPNEKAESMEVGYALSRKHWGQGIMTEAFTAVIRYLFEEVGILRVSSRHDPNNPASGKVMQKCGLKYEGTLRQSDWNNQGICDAAHYSILRHEFTGK